MARLFDDLVFRMEAAEPGEERHTNAGNRQAANQHRVSRDRHFLPQAAHLPHVV